MSESLTAHDFLRLDREAIEDIFATEMPTSVGQPYFRPSQYTHIKNETLDQMKKWKIESTGKAAERKSILNWVTPIVLLGPGTVSLIAQGLTVLTSTLYTVFAMLVISYFWFFGRVWRWEAKTFAANVEAAEKAIEKIRQKRAQEWAEARYDIDTRNVEFTEFSNFYIDGRAYRWKEVEDESFIIVNVTTEEEVPLLPSANK